MPMTSIRRSALGAFTIGLSATLFAACSAATPSASPSESGSPSPTASTAPTASASAAPTPSPTASATGSPVITPQPTPRTGSLTISWTKATSTGSGPGASYSSFASPTATLGDVTVVAPNTQGGDPGPLFWYSVDGLHWTKASVSEPASESIWVADVTVGGPGFVAVGGDTTSDPNGSSGDVAIWTSADGRTWTRIHGPSLGAGELQKIGATAHGLIAFGSDGRHGALWTSTNGTAWSVLDVPDGLAPWGVTALVASDGSLTMFDVASEAEDSPIDVWRATSPTDWTRLGTLAHSAGQRITQVVHGSRGWVANGTATWTSADGVAWSLAPKVPAEIRTLIADARGFIAVGFRVTSSGCVYQEYDTIGQTWTSADGRTWRRMAEDPKQNHGSINTLLIRDGTLYGLALGFASQDAARSVVWTTDLSGFGASSGTEPPPASTPKPPAHTPEPAGCGGP